MSAHFTEKVELAYRHTVVPKQVVDRSVMEIEIRDGPVQEKIPTAEREFAGRRGEFNGTVLGTLELRRLQAA